MQFKRNLLAASVLLATSMPVLAAEPTLPSILNSIDASTWTQISLPSLLTKSWNVPGATLEFTLVSENTGWSNFQTFSVVDGDFDLTTTLLFAGVDTNGANTSYTLETLLSGFVFGETNPNANFVVDKARIYESANGVYAFAHEDWKDKDYNDMVVSMSISAIPEPESYAMILAGLGLMGFSASRKLSK